MKNTTIYLLSFCACLFQINFLQAQCPKESYFHETQLDAFNFPISHSNGTIKNVADGMKLKQLPPFENYNAVDIARNNPFEKNPLRNFKYSSIGNSTINPNIGAPELTNAEGIFNSTTTTCGWANNTDFGNRDRARALTTDASGNIYVTGSAFIEGSYQLYFGKYDAQSNLLFQFTTDSLGGSIIGQDIALNAAGEIFITGWFSGTVDFNTNGGSQITATGSDDGFFAKYDAMGNFMYVQPFNSSTGVKSYGITVDQTSGDVFIAGDFSTSVDLDGDASADLALVGINGMVASFTDNGASSTLNWAQAIGNAASPADGDRAYGITGGTDDIYVSGYYGPDADFGSGATSSYDTGDIFLVAYDKTNGTVTWLNTMGSDGQFDQGTRVAIDQNGDLYTTGLFWDTLIYTTSMGVQNLPSSSANGETFVAKIDGSTGQTQWVSKSEVNGNNYGTGIAVDNNNTVYVKLKDNTIARTQAFDTNTGAKLCEFSLLLGLNASAPNPFLDNDIGIGLNNNLVQCGYFSGSNVDLNKTIGSNPNNVFTSMLDDIYVATYCLPLCCPTGGGSVVYVDADAAGANDGSSWADAFTDLQAALDDAESCDTLWVAEGIYIPSVEMNPGTTNSKTFFISKDLKIYGGFVGTETSIDQRLTSNMQQTILSGDLDGNDVLSGSLPETCITQNGTNAYHVVWLDNVSNNFVLDGFVIQSGNASGSAPDDKGGGIYNDATSSSSLNLKNLWLVGNQAANHGGGIYNNASSGGTISCNLTDVHFYCNSANFGGGIFNEATSGACFNSFEACIFKSNTGTERGGAVYLNWASGNLTDVFTNCLFSGNLASDGGAIFHRASSASTGSPTYNFCTFAANNADVGGALMNYEAQATLQNSIIWGNSSGIADLDGQILGGYNIIENGYLPLANIFDQNPVFTNLPDFNTAPTFDGDFHISDCSPARDKGNAQTTPTEDLEDNVRPADAGYDWGAYENVGSACAFVRLYVNHANAPGGDGLTWGTAFQDFQSAIDKAKNENFGEVWIAQGVYKPTDEEGFLIDFDLDVFGGFFGDEVNLSERDIAQYSTIFSGDADGVPDEDANGDNIISHADSINGTNYRIIELTGENINSKFDGLIFTAGQHSFYGGALYALANSTNHIASAKPNIINCTFAGNRSHSSGGAISIAATAETGAAISSPSIVNTNFYGNKTAVQGGALEIKAGSSSSNSSATTTPNIINTAFSNNTADTYGGGLAIYIFSSLGLVSNDATIINSTFSGNSAQRGSGFYAFNDALYASTNSNIELKNSIFWQNDNEPIFTGGTGGNQILDIYNTLVQAADCSSINFGNATVSCTGTMVFNQDPLFVNAATNNLRIANGSPAIDVGSNTELPTDTYDLDNDGNTAEQIPFDILRLNRIHNGTVDMGAYENDGNYFTDPNAGIVQNAAASGEPTVMPPLNSPAILIRPMTGHIFVKQDATGANNGTSWMDAYNDFQDALTVAQENDSIWVAAGVYKPKIDTNGIAFPMLIASRTFYVNRDLKILGGFAGTETLAAQRDPNANPTILSGDLDGDDENDDGNSVSETIDDQKGINANHVLFLDTLSQSCIIDGFIITAGNATGLIGTNAPASHEGGGGILVYAGGNGKNSSPTISNCKFFGNAGIKNGGAIHNYGAFGGHAAPIISDCTFSGNFAPKGGALANDGTVGGLAAPNINNCQFMDNHANKGGVMWNYGSTSPIVSNSIFESNIAQADGGAIYNSGADTSLHIANGMFKHCIFKANVSDNCGGAIFNIGTENGTDSTKFINCLFSGNSALEYGGSIFNEGKNGTSVPQFNNCTFAASKADNGGAMTNEQSSPNLKNNIFWGNSSEIHDASSVPVVNDNVVENGYLLGTNVITENPMFANQADFNNAPTTGGDFNLTEDSEDVIDKGIDSLIFMDSILVDLANNPRRTDGDYDNVRRVDIGAYEFQSVICDAPNLVLTDGTPGVYIAETITAEGTVVILDSTQVTYIAKTEITLGPEEPAGSEFEVELGAVFEALIGGCTTAIPTGL